MRTWLFCMVFLLPGCSDNGSDTSNKKEKLKLVQQLEKRVAASPDSASLRMRLVNALDSLGRYEEAIVQVDSMILRDSVNNGLWFAKGQLYESNRDTAAAISSYIKAIQLYPSIDAKMHLANLYAEKGDARSLAICEDVAKMRLGRETDANIDFIAGIYYSRTKQYAKAIELFDRSIKNNYTLMEAYMEKGFAWFDQGNYVEALKVFETAVVVNNTYADAYYWQAKCYEATGNKAEAVLNYQRALGLDKSITEARIALERLD